MMETAIAPVRAKPGRPKRDPNAPPKKAYVTNAEIMAAWTEAKKLNKLTPELARCLKLIAERYSYHPWFCGYSYREDMVCAALVNLCVNWHKFNPEKQQIPNPFAYFTTCVYRSFLAYLDDEKTQREIRDELLIEAGASPSFNYQARHGGVSTSDETSFVSASDD